MILPSSLSMLMGGIVKLEKMLKAASSYADTAKIVGFYEVVYAQCKMHRRLDLMKEVQKLWTAHAFRTGYWKPPQGE